MSGMIQQISGTASRAAQSPAATGVKEPPGIRDAEGDAPAHIRKPVMDEYVPEKKQEPSGRYWLGRDEDGQPKVCFDGPKEKAADGRKAEICRGSTDEVDREIERLKKRREELERQIGAEADDTRREALERKLAKVERELSRKDNDAYRRQHTVFS